MMSPGILDRNGNMMSLASLAEALPCQPALPFQVSDGQYETQLRLLDLMRSTGYDMVQYNGQRRTGPPANWLGPPPGPGCEVFIGKIPRDLYEDELFPLLQQFGTVYELRLMMDFSGTNRGFGFVQYATPEQALRAVESLDGYAIRPGKYLGVMKSLDNRRLFVGGLPKDRTKKEIMDELSKLVSGIVDVILYSSVVDKTKNRGFAFVEFESHRVAAIARRKMIPGGVVLWNHDLAVDWAEPEPEVPESVMSRVKVLYMRNLMLSTPEQTIHDVVETIGMVPRQAIEKVKKLKDFAFIHFIDRHFAELALPRLNQINIDGATVSVVWAKPPRDRVHNRIVRGSSLEDGAPIKDDCLLYRSRRPVLPASDCCLITPQCPQSFSQSFNFWDALVAVTAANPPRVEINSIQNPTKVNQMMYIARISLMFLDQSHSVYGPYADTPDAAKNSAAEVVLSWMHLRASQAGVVLPMPTPPPVGIMYAHHNYMPYQLTSGAYTNKRLNLVNC